MVNCFIVYAHENGKVKVPPTLLGIIDELRKAGVDVRWDQDKEGFYDIGWKNEPIQMQHPHAFDYVIVVGTSQLLAKSTQDTVVAQELEWVHERMTLEADIVRVYPQMSGSVIPLLLPSEQGNQELHIEEKVKLRFPRFLHIKQHNYEFFDASVPESYQAITMQIAARMKVPEEKRCMTYYKNKIKSPSTIHNLPAKNEYFTGRKSQLQEIQVRLQRGGVLAICNEIDEQASKAHITISGGGGFGKSQLVKEYANKALTLQESYPTDQIIWFINAKDRLEVVPIIWTVC